MLTRIVVGLILAAVAILAIAMGTYSRLILLLVVSVIANIEMHKAVKRLAKDAKFWPSLIFSILYIPVGYFFSVKYPNAIWILFIFLIMGMFCQRVLSKKLSTEGLVASLSNFIYPIPFLIMMFFSLTLEKPLWQAVTITGIACACLNDTGALFVGKFFGRTKLMPDISPKKTVEGAIGGFIISVLTGGLMFFVQKLFGGDYPIYVYLIAGAFASVAAIVGDLSASIIKRTTKVKDFGKILPGHGGILDRLDSIIFAVPIVYMVFYIAIGI